MGRRNLVVLGVLPCTADPVHTQGCEIRSGNSLVGCDGDGKFRQRGREEKQSDFAAASSTSWVTRFASKRIKQKGPTRPQIGKGERYGTSAQKLKAASVSPGEVRPRKDDSSLTLVQ